MAQRKKSTTRKTTTANKKEEAEKYKAKVDELLGDDFIDVEKPTAKKTNQESVVEEKEEEKVLSSSDKKIKWYEEQVNKQVREIKDLEEKLLNAKDQIELYKQKGGSDSGKVIQGVKQLYNDIYGAASGKKYGTPFKTANTEYLIKQMKNLFDFL